MVTKPAVAGCAAVVTAAAIAAVGPAPALAATAPHAPGSITGHAPAVITGHAPALHPESVDYDPARHAFVVGSMRHGTVSVVRPDGSVHTLVHDPQLISTSGIRVVGNRIYVLNTDPGVGDRTSAATQRRTAGLGVYDRRTGRRIRYVDLAATDPVPEQHFGNDVTVAPDGTAYVTDSFAPVLYQVPAHGRASVFVRDTRLTPAPGDFGANGIVWSQGRLIVGKYDDGTLWRVPVSAPRALRQIPVGRRLTGADGFRLRPDGTLIAVTNSLATPFDGRVWTLRPGRSWSSAKVVRTVAWPDAVPTASAITPFGTYVLSGRLDLLFSGTTTDTFTLRRLS